jgi:hypothetical protein
VLAFGQSRIKSSRRRAFQTYADIFGIFGAHFPVFSGVFSVWVFLHVLFYLNYFARPELFF